MDLLQGERVPGYERGAGKGGEDECWDAVEEGVPGLVSGLVRRFRRPRNCVWE